MLNLYNFRPINKVFHSFENFSMFLCLFYLNTSLYILLRKTQICYIFQNILQSAINLDLGVTALVWSKIDFYALILEPWELKEKSSKISRNISIYYCLINIYLPIRTIYFLHLKSSMYIDIDICCFFPLVCNNCFLSVWGWKYWTLICRMFSYCIILVRFAKSQKKLERTLCNQQFYLQMKCILSI